MTVEKESIAAVKKWMMSGSVRVVRTFLGADQDSNLAGKSAQLAVGVVIYRNMDWLLVAATASLVGVLRYYGIRLLIIFMVLWIGNMLLSGLMIMCAEQIRIDFTLSEGYRRLVDLASSHSRILGWSMEWLLVIYIALWWGAGPLHLFIRNRIKSGAVKLMIFGSVSGIQMAICTGLFVWVNAALLTFWNSISMSSKGMGI